MAYVNCMNQMSAGDLGLGLSVCGRASPGPVLEMVRMPPTYSNMQTLKISHREHRELGDVSWLRDFGQAQALARTDGKPILLLFQEVPGCSTCVNFGHDVLSHSLMVEIIEEHFVPLAILNNHPGSDAEVLRQFGEAAWNNPVIHFVTADGKPVVERLANRYDPLGLFSKIGQVMERGGIAIPQWFTMLGRDLVVEAGLAETATFTTPCFWSGETSLAQHPSVITTDAGWVDGEEVVRVQFDPSGNGRSHLIEHARTEGFAPIGGGGFEVDREPQFYLRKTSMRYLPLSPAQRTAINLAVPYDGNAKGMLSPRQRAWLNDPGLAQAGDDAFYRREIRTAWRMIDDRLGKPAHAISVMAIQKESEER